MSGPAAGLSPAAFRAHFPVLADTVHLACCSLAPRSSALDAAMARMLDELHHDPTPWDLWYEEVDAGRRRFARLVGADPEQVAVVPSATVGAFQVASTCDWAARPGLVTCEGEYSSVAQVWHAQTPRGARVHLVREGRADPTAADHLAAVDHRTALVSVPLLSYRTGTLLPVAEVVAGAHRAGARVFVDAYQGVGVVPVDVGALGCDYLVSGTMKYLLGLPGLAYLYCRAGVREALDPQLTGFYGRRDPLRFDPDALDFPDDARRFQIGIPTLPVALAAHAGLALLERAAPADVARHVRDLVDHAVDRLRGAGVDLVLPRSTELRGPQVGILDADPMGLARSLNARRVFPARGHVVRLSFHHYSTRADVDAAVTAVAQWRAARPATAGAAR